MKKFLKAAVAVAVGMGIATTGVPTLAGEVDVTTRSLTVSYKDLDLAVPAGVDALYGRLRTAAGSVCGPKADGRNLVARFYWKQCYDKALDGAVGKVDHAALSETHLAHTGRWVGAEHRVADAN